MQKKYEVPELTLIGQADEVVMGVSPFGDDICSFLRRISNSNRTKSIMSQTRLSGLASSYKPRVQIGASSGR